MHVYKAYKLAEMEISMVIIPIDKNRGRFKRILSDNSGSTMLVVVLMVSFVMILATVVTSATMLNLKMKKEGKETTRTFYTSEDAVDEIYAALGRTSMECFNNVYEQELSHVTSGTINIGGREVPYATDKTTVNKNFRLNYTYQLIKALGIQTSSGSYEDSYKYSEPDSYFSSIIYTSTTDKQGNDFVKKLNTYIEASVDENGNKVDNPRLSVESISGIKVDKKVTATDNDGTGLPYYVLTFSDCVVRYITEAGYYSYITFDGRLGMPDMLVDFGTDSNSGTDAFADYALVGNTGIEVKPSAQVTNTLTINGSAYAGKKNGIKIGDNSVLSMTGTSANNLVTGGDIAVGGGTLNISDNTNIWCYSLKTLEAQADAVSTINIASGAHTYVKDDLQLDANNSNVVLGGEYYGYGYDGNSLDSKAVHYFSSAIIVNGKNSRLDMNRLNKLVVAGRAYIDFNSLASAGITSDSTAYATGESLSFIGNEEMYLVPSSLIDEGVNPTYGQEADSTGIHLGIQDFFGYRYINNNAGALPYEVKRIRTAAGNDIYYYYLNFKTEQDKLDYIHAVIDDTAFDNILNSLDAMVNVAGSTITVDNLAAVKQKYTQVRNYVKNVITLNAKNINSVVSGSFTDNVYSSADMVLVRNSGDVDDTADKSGGGSVPESYDFGRDFNDIACRFTVLCKALETLPSKNEDGSVKYYTSAKVDAEKPYLSNYVVDDVYNNFIDSQAFTEYTNSAEGGILHTIGSYGYIAVNNSYSSIPLEISSGGTNGSVNISEGIVVASGDVVVKQNFTGVIIAGGDIKVENGVTVTASRSVVEAILKLGDEAKGAEIKEDADYAADFRKVFRAYSTNSGGQGTAAGKDVGSLTYSDMVVFANWRKSDGNAE